MINKANNIYGFYAPLVLFVAIFSSQAVALESETWHYGLDDVGNITSRGFDPLPANATHNYGYDGIYRLTDESNPNHTDQYDYDANSNRIGFTRDGSGITLQIDPASNRLDQVDSDPRTYDDAGNTTSDRNGTRIFTYNDMGRLNAVHENSQLLASYTYNAQGQRAIKTTPTGTTYYDYDLSGALIGEYDETGQVIKEYVHVNGEPVAQLQGTAIAYLHTDHLATPRKATNEAGDVIWEWDSEAFGNEAPVSHDGTEVDLRFPGQVYDVETGFYYNYFRYYDPAVGRYITSDPIGLGGGINTYGYVGGNPVNFTDPTGLITWQESHDLYEEAKANNPLPPHECEIGCNNPITITWSYGLPQAPIKPSVIKKYSLKCLLSFGMLKGGISKGFDKGLDYAKRRAASAGMPIVSSVFGVATGPIGQTVFGVGAMGEVIDYCECD